MLKPLLACTLALLLASCGGGSSTAPTTPTAGTPTTGTPTTGTPTAPTPAPAPVPPSVPAPTARWSDPASWPGGKVPVQGDRVSVPAGVSMLLDVSPPALAGLTVPGGSALTFADTGDLTLSTDWIMLEGTLTIGTEAAPYTHRATITLTDATPGEDVMGMGDRVLGVMGGHLELHGQKRLPWTRLAQTARAGSSTLTLDTPPDWQQGDLIALASTDYDPAQSEQAVVRSVSGRTVTLAQPLTNTHWGDREQAPLQAVDERAEVGLLSRNVLVQSGDDSVTSGRGGHVMVMTGGTARIEGTELNRMGQRNTLRRYPLHFHMLGSASGSYLRDSSLHDLYNRCVTVHGTNDLTVSGNVAYGTTGHCFFMEDGAETGNTFSGNLAMRVRAPDSKLGETPLLTSDKTPAGYWITNPANTFTGNVAAGVDGTGFWYALPEHPTGLSAAAGANTWPRRTPLGTFSGNVAHSATRGLNVDNGNQADGSSTEVMSYRPRTTPADSRSAPVQATFRDFTAFKNRDRGVWLRGDTQLLQGGTLADNAVGVTFAAQDTASDGTLLVGETSNAGHPPSWEATGDGGRSLPRPWDATFPIRGFEFYDGTVEVRNATLARFTPTAQRGASGLGYNRRNPFSLSPQNAASGLKWLDASNRVLLEDPTPGKDGDLAAAFLDRDGSVTGTPGRTVVASNPLLTPGCTRTAAWNASVCAGPFLRLWFSSVSGEKPGTVTVTGAGGQVSLVGTPSAGTSYSTTLPVGGRYALGLPRINHLRLGLEQLKPGQSLRVDLPYTGTPYLYRDWWVDARNALKQVDAAALDATQGDAYALSGGTLSLKLMVKPTEQAAEVELCTTPLCQ
ncbi:G8 domain-containing protein [Deinococcus aquiradiocola]|uniref:G8 domain-containing protein n=1 Tax=Deinococcus aquiradiocola TaxID=393059 RepID=A0A917UKS1_9DEIO|nr:G8 domain-containing protein [Deinococcus aquiradiocola]GGJ63660.1 hypothetical protein GCM10008939_04410 [Deinococcus aquiradiocola]